MNRPADLGYRMPAEWAPHERCWMAWPCREETFSDLAAARAAYAAVARTIAEFEPVTMVVRPDDEKAARRVLDHPHVDTLAMPLDDSWMRDIGPTFVVDDAGRVAGVDWRFNAWGGNYPDHHADAAVAARVLDRLSLHRFAADFVLEGGSIHCDGDGTVLVTEQCLLNPNRNPQLDRATVEDRLRAFLGVESVIWLGEGLEDDETDGHVDNLACFVRPGVVMALTAPDPRDPNHRPLADNVERLRRARDARARRLAVIEVAQPAPRRENGVRLALSHINFYIANGAVVAPCFDDPADVAAADALHTAFPERRIVQLPALDIVRGGGGIHCITQQQPKGAG